MTMSPPSQSDLFQTVSTPFAEDFLAKISATRAKARALKKEQDRASFVKSLDLLASWSQDTLSWRTYQRCLLEEWELSSEAWPRSGMMHNGTAYQLPPLVPLTDATEYGLLPTPVTSRWDKGSREIWNEMLHACADQGCQSCTNHRDDLGPRLENSGPKMSVHLLEWMMGFPIDHTVNDAWGTPSFRKLLKSLVKQSQ